MADTFRGYPVLVRRVRVREREYEIVGPANYESLLDDPRVIARFSRDEFMPYWAEFWPAARVLADLVAQWLPPERGHAPGASGQVQSAAVLEFGCGLGLVGLVAASRGWQALLSDYDEDALAFVQESARRNELHVQTRFVDWREHYPELRPSRIVAAEVLYEPRHLAPIATFIREHLAPGGRAVLCDAFRQTADPFPEVARRAGLQVQTFEHEVASDAAGPPLRARLFDLRLESGVRP